VLEYFVYKGDRCIMKAAPGGEHQRLEVAAVRVAEGFFFCSFLQLRSVKQVAGGLHRGRGVRRREGVADCDVNCEVLARGPPGEEDIGRAIKGFGVDRFLPGHRYAVRLEDSEEPILDGKVAAVGVVLLATHGVVAEDVYGVTAEGAWLTCEGGV